MASRLEARAKVIAAKYPSPPSGFVASPDVQAPMYRYERYLAGRAPLLGEANFFLTLVLRKAVAALDEQGIASREVSRQRSASTRSLSRS